MYAHSLELAYVRQEKANLEREIREARSELSSVTTQLNLLRSRASCMKMELAVARRDRPSSLATAQEATVSSLKAALHYSTMSLPAVKTEQARRKELHKSDVKHLRLNIRIVARKCDKYKQRCADLWQFANVL